MENKLISVIVPVYNIENYIRECLESILAQSYAHFEAIVIDDGSTDGSSAICNEFAELDNRVTVIRQENRGLVGAWKRGVEIASGEYICFIDGDDFISHDYLQTLIDAMTEDVDMVCMNCIKYSQDKQSKYTINELSAGVHEVDGALLRNIINNTLHRGNKLIGNARWSKLIRTEIVKEYASYCSDEVSFGEDQQLTVGMILGCRKIRILDEYKYYYRSNPTSIMNSYKKDLWNRSKLLIKTIEAIPDIKKIDNYKEQLKVQLFDYVCECLKNEQFYGGGITRTYFSELYRDVKACELLHDRKLNSGSKFNRLLYKAFRKKCRLFIVMLLNYYKHKKLSRQE